MSEFEQGPPPEAFAPSPESQRIHDKELAHLGALVTEAAMRDDLIQVVAEHVERTGVDNPNSYAPNQMRIGEQVVPESSESVYRQVTERGVQDLGEGGIVRGAYTAGNKAKTSGHTTYWNSGETGKGSTLGQGFVIEAPLAEAENGWVTADKVTGVYAKDSDGVVKNILATDVSKEDSFGFGSFEEEAEEVGFRDHDEKPETHQDELLGFGDSTETEDSESDGFGPGEDEEEITIDEDGFGSWEDASQASIEDSNGFSETDEQPIDARKSSPASGNSDAWSRDIVGEHRTPR